MALEIDDALASASRCEVFDAGMLDGRPLADQAALTLEGNTVMTHLRWLLRVHPDGGFHCMCLGDAALRFTSEDGRVLATVGLHHAASLRWDGWEGDRELVDGPALVEWLAARGFAKPLQGLQASRTRAADDAAVQRAWSRAVPEPAAHLLPRMLATSQSGTVPPDLSDEVSRALARAWPDDLDRCRSLLIWFGAGTGRYSGYPLHEEIPGILLAEIPIGVVVQVLQQNQADSSVWRGAVRHLAGWRTRTAKELRAVPLPVRQQLLTVAEGQDDVHARRLRHIYPPQR